MTVKELREALNKYPDNMEVLVKRVGSVMIELEGDVGYVRSVKESKYTMFGIDFPCALLTDDDLPCALLTDESDKGGRKRMKANIYEELRNSMTVQDAARVLKETNCYGTMDIAKNVILKALEEQMSSSEEPNKWIPISKETPKKQGYYITSTIYNEVFCDYWNGDNFDRTEAVLAWLPKPAPYKPQERDNESCDEIWEKAYAERDGKK